MINQEKPVIGIFGRRNNGKSTLVNCLTGQDVSIVSPLAGTTSDPVKKSLELPGAGAAILLDTPGVDDDGSLGAKRFERVTRAINQVDLAILVIAGNATGRWETLLVDKFNHANLPFVVVHNKSDLEEALPATCQFYANSGASSFVNHSRDWPPDPIFEALTKSITGNLPTTRSLIGDLIENNDLVLLITPIDNQAPAGRLILPQVQTIRDALDNRAIVIVLRETELAGFIQKTNLRPKIAITDSQLFEKANELIPAPVMLTSFSILLARYKGNFEAYKKGTPELDNLEEGSKVLILESCTHHPTCDDIGRVKIPGWVNKYKGKRIVHEVVAGLDPLPADLSRYSLVIQCGGCMITRRQLNNRLRPAIEAGIPVTNYGMAIAWLHGIYERAMQPFNMLPASDR